MYTVIIIPNKAIQKIWTIYKWAIVHSYVKQSDGNGLEINRTGPKRVMLQGIQHVPWTKIYRDPKLPNLFEIDHALINPDGWSSAHALLEHVIAVFFARLCSLLGRDPPNVWHDRIIVIFELGKIPIPTFMFFQLYVNWYCIFFLHLWSSMILFPRRSDVVRQLWHHRPRLPLVT